MASYLHFNSGYEKNEYESNGQRTIVTMPIKFSHSLGYFILTFE